MTDLGRGFTNFLPGRPIAVGDSMKLVPSRPFLGRSATNFVDPPTEIGRPGTNLVVRGPRSVVRAPILCLGTDRGCGPAQIWWSGRPSRAPTRPAAVSSAGGGG